MVVGLSEANSNKFRALLDTKPSATPTAIVSPPAQDGQVVTELKQHPRYLSEEEIQEVIIRYQECFEAQRHHRQPFHCGQETVGREDDFTPQSGICHERDRKDGWD